jgi:hypothetical protein
VAAIGGRAAAAREDAAHRRAHGFRRKRFRVEGSYLCVHSSACGPRLDRWPQRADGPSVGRNESENHDRFSTSAICHELLRPITLRVAVLPLDSAERITALHHQPQPKVSKVRVFSFVASGGGLVLVDQSQDESHDRPIRRPHFARDSCGVKDAVSVRKAERCRKEANKPKTPSPRILATSIGKLRAVRFMAEELRAGP